MEHSIYGAEFEQTQIPPPPNCSQAEKLTWR